MRIGIIGAGNIGGTLARRLTALGHDVSIANSRGPETLAELARETGAKAVTVARRRAPGKSSSSPFPKRSSQAAGGLFAGVPADVVVVDTGNYYPHSATARSRPSSTACRRAAGCRTGSAGRW